MKRSGVMAFFGLSMAVAPLAQANEAKSDKPVLELRSADGYQWARLGGYFSVGSRYRIDPAPDTDSSGFFIGNARLSIDGQLQSDFDYFVQMDLARTSQPLVDLFTGWSPDKSFRLQVGLFKTPFSYEFLQGAPSVEMADRAQIVRALAPNRRVGVQVGGTIPGTVMFWKLGGFNGTRDLANDGDAFMGALRVGVDAKLDAGRLEAGVNGATGTKDALPVPFVGGNPESLPWLAGVDLRFDAPRGFVQTEFDAGGFETGGESQLIWGYHVTGGVRFLDKWTVLARWDHLDGDALADESKIVALGVNHDFTSWVSLQIDYWLPIDDMDAQGLWGYLDVAL